MPYLAEVLRLFNAMAARPGTLQENPVTGGNFVYGLDPIQPQMRAADRALRARRRFASENPGLPPLPVSREENWKYKSRWGLDYLLAAFARSLEANNYKLDDHPSFDRYARGVMASPYAPELISRDQQLLSLFPPLTLPRLGRGLFWESGKAPAAIRFAPPDLQSRFLSKMPPMDESEVIAREDANVPDGYARWGQKFVLLHDEFIAHATKFASSQRLPRDWQTNIEGESYFIWKGQYFLVVRACDHGWIIERTKFLVDGDEILTNTLLDAPVICATAAAAARLAEASNPSPSPRHQLAWYTC